jgi:hypothetical protein
MALGAVVQVQALTHGTRIRIGGDCLGVHLGVALEQRSDLGIGNADFALMGIDRSPLQHALEAAETGIGREINHGENDGDPEQPDPPARQRIVPLGQRFVPLMTVQLDRTGRAGAAVGQDDEDTEQQTGDDEHHHVCIPEVVDEVAHLLSPVSMCARSSSAKGSIAASWCARCALGRQAMKTMAMKQTKPATVTAARNVLMS